MSADNYYSIRIHPLGGFAAVMGFASNEEGVPAAYKSDVQFSDVEAALDWAMGEYSEYGVSVHPECLEAVLAHEFTNFESALNLATNEYPEHEINVNKNNVGKEHSKDVSAESVPGWREVHNNLEPRFITEGFCGFYPPDGWLGLVQKIDDVLKVNPNYRIVQIKQKFGELRFYAHGLTGYEQAFVTEMENKSLYICEICGSENDTVAARNDSWILTLCNECAANA